MSLFLALIILLLVWFLLISPFIKLFRVSRQWQNTFKQAQQQQQQRYRQQQQRQRNPQPESKKKIDPAVGEYVEFTETQVTHTTTEADGSSETTHMTESQITDVTWEDLPPQK